MKRRHLAQLAVLASLLLATPTLGAEDALSLHVTPKVSNAPAAVVITVTVARNEKNRKLVVEDDSESYYRSSQVTLEGENAARTHRLVFRGLTPGEHRIRAVVHGTSGSRAAAWTTVLVVGAEPSQ